MPEAEAPRHLFQLMAPGKVIRDFISGNVLG
jgi:hypothetical protein